ncbi:MAG TPA: universal stress protein [bacterium]|nr:universal stress protein [bacterium]
MLKRILLIIDASPQMEIAADYALAIAARHGSQLLLFPLADKSSAPAGAASGELLLGPTVQRAEAAGLSYQVLSTSALPFSRSLEWSRCSDIAVLPYLAPKSAARMEKRVVRLLTDGGCPVLLPSAAPLESKVAAVAWDGSSAMARALKLHLQLFRRSRLRYLLVHMGDHPDKALSILEQGCALVEAQGAAAETLALSGAPVPRILELSASIRLNHLIVAPHSRRLFSKQRLGPTSGKLLRSRVNSLFLAT